MSLAKRAKLDLPSSSMNGKLENGYDCPNGVEDETKASELSSQEIMALRAKHIG